jgi:hypothetical protein
MPTRFNPCRGAEPGAIELNSSGTNLYLPERIIGKRKPKKVPKHFKLSKQADQEDISSLYNCCGYWRPAGMGESPNSLKPGGIN